MNVLHIVGSLPTVNKPYLQPFVLKQIESLQKLGLNIYIVNIQGDEGFFNYFRKSSEIKKILKTKKIDVIHVHYSYSLIPLLFIKYKVPVVLSLMGSEILGARNRTGQIRLRGHCDIWFTKFVIRFANHIIVKSKHMAAKVKHRNKISVLPNGIDFGQFAPKNKNEIRKKLKLSPNSFVILFLGSRQKFSKNYDLAKLAADKFIKTSDINSAEFINPYGTPYNQVVDYYDASDVLLFTSFIEGSPNVVKEAMACNLPIISVDVGDVKEVIEGTDNCFIVPYNADAIAEKLNIIYYNRNRTNGREHINHLKSEVIAQRLVEIYYECISMYKEKSK